ncbi:MAG: hypothetical protein IPO32_19195 [Crocinitomicaceae bacterium]|nr:hypothetical protein [Crocinitomicaceae bacterium]MBK6953784.1 hypothetical protein [Crocinitomicaceae bacterium]MBK9593529.1 hypothetical protein [Crocinitomicaceae bacterium]
MLSFNFPVHSAYQIGNSQVKNPFNLEDLSGINVLLGMYVELTQVLKGMKTGMVIASDNGNRWIIVCRVIHSPAFDYALKFPNETVYTMPLPGYEDIDVASVSKNMIRKEEQGIMIYRIEPMGHTEKPVSGEILKFNLEIQESIKNL